MAIATYKKIASVTVGSGGQAAMEFTNIPGTYNDLLVKVSGRSTRTGSTADYGLITINGSTSSFTGRQLTGTGSAAASSTPARETGSFPATDATASTFGNAYIYFPNYTGSTNKSFSIDNVTENNATLAYAILYAGLWSNTSIINSISLTLGNGPNWAQYSTATLYGIVRSN